METASQFFGIDTKVIIEDFDEELDGETGILVGFYCPDDVDPDAEPEEILGIVMLDKPTNFFGGMRAVCVPLGLLDVLDLN